MNLSLKDDLQGCERGEKMCEFKKKDTCILYLPRTIQGRTCRKQVHAQIVPAQGVRMVYKAFTLNELSFTITTFILLQVTIF